MMKRRISQFLQKISLGRLQEEDGMAAVEAAYIFPILLTMMLGVFDIGNGIIANQKTIRASQVTADLIARHAEVDTARLNEAIQGGQQALLPLSDTSYGVDIVSIAFDDDGAPVIEWRETRNMVPIADVLTRVQALAEADEGVLVVAVEYLYEPLFAGFVVDDMQMQEIAFARGRKSAVIERN
ncbi:MAG: pilus assembly protein [Alphaproteobacteria bacterium]|nr:pilus assembly protein [Alphaproteobacteria bacterium]